MKQYLLVAGYNYYRAKKEDKSDYVIYCHRRKDLLIKQNLKKETLRFIIYDFFRGTIETIDVTYPGGKRKEKKNTVKSFDPIKTSDYDKFPGGAVRLKKNKPKIASILNIYEAVQNIGKGVEAGSLMELSFFSHAYFEGPILLNTDDEAPGAARDPNDKDPRPQKDFIAPTMNAAQLKNFKDAYHPKGINWIWGCNASALDKSLLHYIRKNKAYNATNIADDTEFMFYMVSEIRDTYFPAPHPARKSGGRIVIKFKDLKKTLCDEVHSTYAHHLASASNRNCYAALLGMGASEGKDGLLEVKSHGANKTLFKNHLNISIDPEKRGYGIYVPNYLCP